jgi:hypothetical protein
MTSFLNPQSCRRADGQPYTLENRVYTQDISMAYAQRQFICDKLHFGPDQKNDLALSPVSVAFAAQEHMISPYAPTNVAQLFRFVDFYARWYRSGCGGSHPRMLLRAHARQSGSTSTLKQRYCPWATLLQRWRLGRGRRPRPSCRRPGSFCRRTLRPTKQ